MSVRWCLLPLLAAILSPLEARETFSPTETEALGRALYDRQRMTEIALDFVGEYYDPEADGITAWVIEDSGSDVVMSFLAFPDGQPQVVVNARFSDSLIPELMPGPAALGARQRAQLQARVTVRPLVDTPCAERYDSLSLRHPHSDDLLVYAMPIAADADEVLLGGHYRYRLDPEGSQVRENDALATACTRASVESLRGTTLESGVAVRNLLDDTPHEIHVFLSLRYKIPLYVITRDLRLWEVRDGRMRVVRERPGE